MTKVVSAVPMTDQQGNPKSFTGQNGTIWSFWYTLDNGMQGEVTHKTQQPRFPVGSEVEASDNTNPQYPQYKKLKLEKPGGAQGGKTWSPEKDARIQAQGMVQAAIAQGATSDEQIDSVVRMGLNAVDRWAKKILAAAQQTAPQQPAAPPQNPNPIQYRPDAPPVGNYPAGPQYQQPAPQQPIGGFDPNLPF